MAEEQTTPAEESPSVEAAELPEMTPNEQIRRVFAEYVKMHTGLSTDAALRHVDKLCKAEADAILRLI